MEREVVVRLPGDFPPGEAEILVIKADPDPTEADAAAWLDGWLASLPATPVIPLSSLDRAELYR